MSKKISDSMTRRKFLKGTTAMAGMAAASGIVPYQFAIGDMAKVKIGILLPYSGTYAMLGNSITDALKLRIDQEGGKLGGREVEFVQVDSQMSVPNAPQNTKSLFLRV